MSKHQSALRRLAAFCAGPLAHALTLTWLGEVGPHVSSRMLHVRVAVPLERGLQLLQLLACEVRALPPLLLFLAGSSAPPQPAPPAPLSSGPLGSPPRSALKQAGWGRQSPQALPCCTQSRLHRSARGQRWRPTLPPGGLELSPLETAVMPGRSVVTFWSGSSGSKAQGQAADQGSQLGRACSHRSAHAGALLLMPPENVQF